MFTLTRSIRFISHQHCAYLLSGHHSLSSLLETLQLSGTRTQITVLGSPSLGSAFCRDPPTNTLVPVPMVAHHLSIQWAIVLALSLYPQLATSAPTPTRSRAGPTLVVKRNAAAVPTSATGVTQLLPQSQLDPSATSTLASSASPAQTSNTGNLGYGTFFGSGLPSNFLTWISIVVVVGIVVALLIARSVLTLPFFPSLPLRELRPSSNELRRITPSLRVHGKHP